MLSPTPTVTGFLALTLIAGVAYLTAVPLNHDVGWYLFLSERVVDGADLYTDIFDINAPFVTYFVVPAVWVSRAIGTPLVPTFYLYVTTLLAGGLTLSWALLLQLKDAYPALRPERMFLALAFVSFVLPLPIFGQREHLLFVFVTPYLLAAAIRAERRPIATSVALCAGIAAGAAMLLKPYYPAVWMAVEVYLFFTARSGGNWRRAETLGVVTVGVIGTGLAFAFERDYVQVVAVALDTYQGYDISTAERAEHIDRAPGGVR